MRTRSITLATFSCSHSEDGLSLIGETEPGGNERGVLLILEEDGVRGESGVRNESGVSGEAQEEGVVVAPLPLRALSLHRSLNIHTPSG